ncbi:MAG: hypothetical protein C4530_15465 [Desulfobacteraceae bacterium]|nr:MAG: hypothetical protein C4530_15465 [Desulfobacteraceae bacterium]
MVNSISDRLIYAKGELIVKKNRSPIERKEKPAFNTAFGVFQQHPGKPKAEWPSCRRSSNPKKKLPMVRSDLQSCPFRRG